MTKKVFIIIVVVMISLSLLILLIYFGMIKPGNECFEYYKAKSFSGIIKDVKFDAKSIPTVKILDSSYYLGMYSYSVSKFLQINDSLVKECNSIKYILYRKDNSGNWRLIYGVPQ